MDGKIASGTVAPSNPVMARSGRGETRGAKDRLVDAAKRLLPDRAPSAITGRDLAAEAGVNYGLVHHYFGGKDGVLAAGLAALHDDFLATHGDPVALRLLTDGDPYFRALVRSQVDYPDTIHYAVDFPIGPALVEAVHQRLSGGVGSDEEKLVAAKARVIAMFCLQVCFNAFGPALLDSVGVSHRERGDVEAALDSLYEAIARPEPPPIRRRKSTRR